MIVNSGARVPGELCVILQLALMDLLQVSEWTNSNLYVKSTSKCHDVAFNTHT